jgi:hypothetical protein
VVFLLLIVSATFWKPNLDPTHPFDIRVEQVASTRFQAATSSLISLATHPVFGTGLSTHPGVARGLPFDAHLTPVNIAGTLGLPALIAFAFLIATLWMRRSRPTDLAIWGGLAGLALDGLAQDVEDFRHVWVMIGVTDAKSREDDQCDRA